MNKEEIINHIIEETDWNLITALRDMAMESKYPNSVTKFEVPQLKQIGKELLETLLENPDYSSSGTAMLEAFRNNDEGLAHYGLRFICGSTEADWFEKED